jgi:hypothetical protein
MGHLANSLALVKIQVLNRLQLEVTTEAYLLKILHPCLTTKIRESSQIMS